ncbi:unnamed protein product [Amoebophrya sp. A120]|nr:unnamed protein product [Amoebophrya sp. A120]|eukprot:GSA120T00016820001.1
MGDEGEEPVDTGPKCPFSYYVVQLSGMTIQIENTEEPNTTKDVDLRALILEQLELDTFAQKSKFCVVDAAGLADKVAAEVATRHAAKQEGIDAAETPPEEEKVDVIFVVTNCPEDVLAAESDPGIHSFLYLHGKSVLFEKLEPEEDAAEDAEPVFEKKIVSAEVPAEVLLVSEKLQEAEFGNWKRDVKLQTLGGCENLYLDGGVKPAKVDDEEPPPPSPSAFAECLYEKLVADHLRKETEFAKREAFVNSIEIPHIDELPPAFHSTAVYERDMGLVDACKHDIALFLHCLTDQAEKNVAGSSSSSSSTASGPASSKGLDSEAEEIALEKYLEKAYCNTVTEDDPDVERIKQSTAVLEGAENALLEPDLRVKLVPSLDRAMVKHLGQKNATNVTKVFGCLKYLTQFHNPQIVMNDGKLDYLGMAERSAHRNRIYPFFPEEDWSIVEIERLLLLYEFEQLLKSCQPERSHELHKTRLYHEKIPKTLFAQTLHKCLSEGSYALDSKYYPRHDAVLIALHNRAVPGRSTWHRWVDARNLTSKASSAQALREAQESAKQATAKLNLHRNPPPPPDANPSKKKKGLVEEPVEKKRTPEEEAVFRKIEARLLAEKDFYDAQCRELVKLIEVFGNLDEDAFGQLEESEKIVLPADGSLISFSDCRRGKSQRNTPPGAEKEIFSAENSVFQSKTHRVTKDGVFLQVKGNAEFEARKPKLLEILSEADAQQDAANRAVETEEPPEEYPVTEFAVMKERTEQVCYGELAVAYSGSQTRVAVSMETSKSNVLSQQMVEECHALCFPGGQPADDGTEPAEKPNLLEFPPVADLTDEQVGFEFSHRPSMMTYTLEDSQKVEINPDGSCFVHWPSSSLTGNSKASSSSSSVVAGSDASYYEAGQMEDLELSRRVQPDGTLIRFLTSGRTELYYPDGTIAFRNPTAEELSRVPVNGSEWLAHLQLAYGSLDLTDENNLQAGLPGHWVVTKLDGTRVGRVDASLLPPPEPSPAENEEEAPPADGEEIGTVIPERTLRTVLEERGLLLVDDGEKVEYPLKPVSTVTQQDPHTGYWVTTAANGLMVIESEDHTQRRIITKDATVITWQHADVGEEVIVEKPDVMPKIIATQDTSSLQANTTVKVFLSDGSLFEVAPKELHPEGQLVPCPIDRVATHSTCVFKHAHSGSILRSNGLGQIDVFTASDIAEQGEEALLKAQAEEAEGYYTCNLVNKVELKLMDRERNKFYLKSDQTVDFQLAVSMNEDGTFEQPKCEVAMKQYCHPDAAFLPVPPTCPAARLFVVYSDGEAEELVERASVDSAFNAVKDDDAAVCVRDEKLTYPLDGCRSNTIYRLVPAMPRCLPYHETIQLPNCVRGIYSPMAILDLPIEKAAAIPEFTTFSQFIEYPQITDQRKADFLVAKNNYHRWEYEHSAVWAELQRKEAERKAKEAKKKKKPDGKKGKKAEEPEEPPEEPYAGPPYSVDELVEKVITCRAKEAKRITPEELYRDVIDKRPDVMATRIQSSMRAKKAKKEVAALRAEEERKRNRPVTPPVDPSLKKVELSEEEKALNRKPPTHVDLGLNFKYFESQQGLKFLLDTGKLDPDARTLINHKPKMPDLDLDQKIKSIWQPPLVYEEPDAYLDTAELFENSHAEFDYGYERGLETQAAEEQQRAEQEATQKEQQMTGGSPNAAGGGNGQMVKSELGDDTFYPNPPEDRRPSRPSSPVGPHPDKKGPHWDIYGNKRMAGKAISQAFVSVNDRYLQVEGPTDRRTRTSSVVNKKNALEAPSVQQVLKSGNHLLTGDPKQTLPRAKGAITELKTEDRSTDIKWELSATLQGLGDQNKLVDAVPGHVRFGLLRRGGVYQITLQLKNLDCEQTRFNVKLVQGTSEYVKVNYVPKSVAPGLAMNVTIELWAHHSAKILQVIEARCKAHVVKIPVSARILEPDEYDRLDAESVLLNGKRILGNHVRLQEWSEDKLGANYIPPNDFQSMAESHGNDSPALLRKQQQMRIYGKVVSDQARDPDGGDDPPAQVSYSDPEQM